MTKMKYIRTKDGIFEFEYITPTCDYACKNNKYFLASDVIKYADTIEELCDEFVFHDIEIDMFTIFPILLPLQKRSKINVDYEQFGAIWTDKGLIYVAKMNSKGEMELI